MVRPPVAPRVRRRVWPALLLPVLVVAGSLGATGCTASESSPPTGVDTLTIPTPDPDPEDFVAEVDNRWLPLPVGAEWVYAVAGEGTAYRVRVSAAEGPDVLGISTTAVHLEPLVGPKQLVSTTPRTDWYAQDRDGNVWWFGTEGGWRAGESGAEAGLAMPAEPRFGDGFRMGLAPGLHVRAEVTGLDAEAGTLELQVHRGENTRTEGYVAGVGLESWSSRGAGTWGVLDRHDLDG